MTADATGGRRAAASTKQPRYSLVVPVYNEADNIASFCKALARLPPGYEVLVCYDFEGDNTLAALDRLPAEEKPSSLRLILNTLGPGVRFAIEAGMRVAASPVVVVTMADLSDDFSRVEEMVSRVEAGADVVCASRYMPGGQQIGGPRVKSFLSRAAGLTLHRLSGLPTRDPTNSFKAYNRNFLERTPIESHAGFCLALELTVKAHFGGGRVEEVPATWRDRSSGKSRFRMLSWLPLYLRWYLWALRGRWLSGSTRGGAPDNPTGSAGTPGPRPGGATVLDSIAPRTLTLLLVIASALGLLSLPIGGYDDSILMVGSRLVASGKLPYIDFYTHYGPLGYTILAALVHVFGHPGLALRIGQATLLIGIAVLLHLLFRSLKPGGRRREYAAVPVMLVFSQVAMEPAFFGFALAAGSFVLFTIARSASRVLPASLLAGASGLALAAAALIRPGFGAYGAGALLLMEVAAGRPRFGVLRSPLVAMGLLFGTAALATFLMGTLLYPRISPKMAFEATVIVPAQLVSAGARFLRPGFLRDVWTIPEGIATGSALVVVTIAWTFAVARLKLRRVAGACIAAGGVLPFWLMLSGHPARHAGFLALTLFALAGLVVFAGRPELKESALLRASATFGLAAAAFGHYFWARADLPHLLPLLALAFVGGALLATSVRPLARAVLAGMFLLVFIPALTPLHVPAARLFERGLVTNLRPWRCTVYLPDAVEAISLADRLADPGSLFVAVGSNQAWSSGNPVMLFLISSRLPYTRWFQYDPGLQTSPAVQKEMERELEASGSRSAVVWRSGQFRWSGEDPRNRVRSPFDDFFDRLYPTTAAWIGPYEVRVRAPGLPDAR